MCLNQKQNKFIVCLLLLCVFLFCGCDAKTNLDPGTTCMISINCNTALTNSDILNADLLAMLPEDGLILAPTEITLNEGDSVFDVLMRTVREYNIHMEYVDTPLYDSAYIEGIANLYEFDAGTQSGWMYRVNGKFPNYGCSGYAISEGDVIEWVYTCDLGNDVGNDNAERMQ